ncbi:ribonuclease G [SAR92 clade bacterium H921]|nr:ribonuclease G [SAR92 clade bacterium H921]
MTREILINITPMETRVALVENGVPQEISIERNQRSGLVGNIYQGKVVRILPGMQAAFIDIGVERTGFLHIDDLVDTKPSITSEPAESMMPEIQDLLHDGEKILVQVIKDPIGSKGARLTARLSIASRYLVYMDGAQKIGISQRIEDEAERERLKSTVSKTIDELAAAEPPVKTKKNRIQIPSRGGSYILRTAAEGASDEELRIDMRYLQRVWKHLAEIKSEAVVPSCLYEELPLSRRVLRDMASADVEKVLVDSREVLDLLVKFANKFSPEIASLLEHYPGERPLFYLYGIEDDIAKALQRTVGMKSGGHLVIDQTEAMTTIDVNTGAFVGNRNLEETAFKTNLEAAVTTARQIRMRNLGGIIIVDFIDMQNAEHRRQVLRTFEKSLDRDRARTTMSGVTELGLVQVTRKRTSESLGQILCECCPTCEGRGSIKSAETVSYEVLREILRVARAYECENLRVLASPSVIERLLDEDSAQVADLELFIGRSIQFRAEDLFAREQFDIIPV